MTTPFSRLMNFRQKKMTAPENAEDQLKLALQEDDSYKPSSIHHSRTNTRLLKGKIDKSNPIVYDIENQFRSNKVVPDQKNHIPINTPDQNTQSLKLVINDSPSPKKKQPQANPQPTHNRTHKRINIIKENPSAPKENIQQTIKKTQSQKVEVIKQSQPQIKENILQSVENIAIQECQQQQSTNLDQENDLVICPEGCGRKFNRKAFEKHVKACKTVFMSKRKQFNSEAKRLTSKQQATLIKQAKIKEKQSQFSKTKSKGFDKTGQNWKVASQQFRSALKGVKIQQAGQMNQQQDLAAKIVACEYCQKKFNEIFIEKHLEKCLAKKQKDKKTAQKKRK